MNKGWNRRWLYYQNVVGSLPPKALILASPWRWCPAHRRFWPQSWKKCGCYWKNLGPLIPKTLLPHPSPIICKRRIQPFGEHPFDVWLRRYIDLVYVWTRYRLNAQVTDRLIDIPKEKYVEILEEGTTFHTSSLQVGSWPFFDLLFAWSYMAIMFDVFTAEGRHKGGCHDVGGRGQQLQEHWRQNIERWWRSGIGWHHFERAWRHIIYGHLGGKNRRWEG